MHKVFSGKNVNNKVNSPDQYLRWTTQQKKYHCSDLVDIFVSIWFLSFHICIPRAASWNEKCLIGKYCSSSGCNGTIWDRDRHQKLLLVYMVDNLFLGEFKENIKQVRFESCICYGHTTFLLDFEYDVLVGPFSLIPAVLQFWKFKFHLRYIFVMDKIKC